MGARLLMETLNYMDKKPNSFRNIILASPDIESDTFFNLFHRSKDVFKKMTLYNNAGDLALLASKFIHTHPRAGIRGNIDFYQRKIDIIETSNLERLFSLGHASFAENRAVISDIYYIIKNELGPQERAGLIRNTNGQKKTSYWKFKA
jgi:esterase/lipase superfamily enzyme